jgi:hypothetical protein
MIQWTGEVITLFILIGGAFITGVYMGSEMNKGTTK